MGYLEYQYVHMFFYDRFFTIVTFLIFDGSETITECLNYLNQNDLKIKTIFLVQRDNFFDIPFLPKLKHSNTCQTHKQKDFNVVSI